jgi:hypothetical protein
VAVGGLPRTNMNETGTETRSTPWPAGKTALTPAANWTPSPCAVDARRQLRALGMSGVQAVQLAGREAEHQIWEVELRAAARRPRALLRPRQSRSPPGPRPAYCEAEAEITRARQRFQTSQWVWVGVRWPRNLSASVLRGPVSWAGAGVGRAGARMRRARVCCPAAGRAAAFLKVHRAGGSCLVPGFADGRARRGTSRAQYDCAARVAGLSLEPACP